MSKFEFVCPVVIYIWIAEIMAVRARHCIPEMDYEPPAATAMREDL